MLAIVTTTLTAMRVLVARLVANLARAVQGLMDTHGVQRKTLKHKMSLVSRIFSSYL